MLTSCADVAERTEAAEALAKAAGYQKLVIDTNPFRLLSFERIRRPGANAVVYIEGDGLAFTQRNIVSLNPTPVNPVGLKLALLDDSANVIYLARPCQYIPVHENPDCHFEFWTTMRYAPEVIQSMNQEIDYYKNKYNIGGIRLVGYSGGGAVGATLAARRKDVIDLRTIAGNLDISAFTRYHKVTPLTGSLNPADYAKELSTVPQIHFTGTADDIITDSITGSYLSAIKKYDPGLSCVVLQKVEGASHTRGWEGVWRQYQQLKGDCK